MLVVLSFLLINCAATEGSFEIIQDCPFFGINDRISIAKNAPNLTTTLQNSEFSVIPIFHDRDHMMELVAPYVPEEELCKLGSHPHHFLVFFSTAIWLPEKNMYLATARLGILKWISYVYITYFDSEGREVEIQDYIGATKVPGFIPVPETDGILKNAGHEDPRLYLGPSNELLLTLNMLDENLKRRMWIYDIAKGKSQPYFYQEATSTASPEKNWVLIKIDEKRNYFVYNFQGFQTVACSHKNGECSRLTGKHKRKLGVLRGGSNYVQFRSTQYYWSLAWTHIDETSGCKLYRPALTLISASNEKPYFKLIYTSEPIDFGGVLFLEPYANLTAIPIMDGCRNSPILLAPSIVTANYEDDIVVLTISIDDQKSYVIKVKGFTGVIQDILDFYEAGKLPAENDCAGKFAYSYFNVTQPSKEKTRKAAKIERGL